MSASLTGPLISSPFAIDPAWIDYNGHLNMAYYNVIFDRAFDEVLLPTGLGPSYVREKGCTFMTVEAHICYLREVFRTDTVRVNVRVLDLDEKRMHAFCEMRHATEDWLAATSEWMFLHVDLKERRAAPWPPEIFQKLDALRQSTAHLPPPERAGRRIGIPRKSEP
ncbi:MAG: thioesterase family protein [Pseudomonadota bacterium]|jgi:acyl-CoA thioester hydrolase|nr:MAG: thioesterase [Pseudomonadota bacterium]